MKLKEKLAEEYRGSEKYIPEARLSPNQLNRELTAIEDAYLAGFEKARKMACQIEWNAAGNSEQLYKFDQMGEKEVCE